jgi:hypothetical protein
MNDHVRLRAPTAAISALAVEDRRPQPGRAPRSPPF